MSKQFVAAMASIIVATAAGCASDVGESSMAVRDPGVVLCVDTLDCGGLCGTEREIQVFLAQCGAGGPEGGPAGACHNQCWSACRHSGERSGRLVACTEECRMARCPENAGSNGLIQAGFAECPAPAPDSICFLLYAPVDCGGCIYSNSCFAAAAGFTGGQCQPVGDTTTISL